MPVLRTNYLRPWTARRKMIGGYSATRQAGRVYLGPVEFSICANTNASGIAWMSAQGVQSIFGQTLAGGCQLKPLDIQVISISSYSNSAYAGTNYYSGTIGVMSASLQISVEAASMWASGSLAVFSPQFSDVTGPTGSAPVVVRMVAVVCSGP